MVDVDLIGGEMFASGALRPLANSIDNVIEIKANGVTIKIECTIK